MKLRIAVARSQTFSTRKASRIRWTSGDLMWTMIGRGGAACCRMLWVSCCEATQNRFTGLIRLPRWTRFSHFDRGAVFRDQLAVLERNFAVNEHEIDAARKLVRVLDRGVTADCLRSEDC